MDNAMLIAHGAKRAAQIRVISQREMRMWPCAIRATFSNHVEMKILKICKKKKSAARQIYHMVHSIEKRLELQIHNETDVTKLGRFSFNQAFG